MRAASTACTVAGTWVVSTGFAVVRPEDVQVAREPPLEGVNAVRVRVREVLNLGGHVKCVAATPGGLELLPYWLLGVAGDEGWDDVSTPQKAAADAYRAPKLPTHPDFVGPLNYAFHFDAVTLAEMLRDQGIANGVDHLVDTVSEVLQFVDYSPSDLLGRMRNNVEQALRKKLMTIEESRTLINRFRQGMIGYTYLDRE